MTNHNRVGDRRESVCCKWSTKMLINVEKDLGYFFEVEEVQILSSQTVSISHEKSLVVTHHLFSAL